MLRKANLPSSNNSKAVLMILSGAKKRRAMALAAVQRVNEQTKYSKGLTTVK